jgi:hypothetical protein
MPAESYLLRDDRRMTHPRPGPSPIGVLGTCTDTTLDIEFAYTSWQQSCRNLYSIEQACRRPGGHADAHAAGFGAARVRWLE